MDKVKEKLSELAKRADDGAILPQVLLDLTEANENIQKRLADISVKIQEAPEGIKQSVDEKLTEANENIQKRLADISVKIQEAPEGIKQSIDEKLTEANENTKKRLDDIAVKIQEAPEGIKQSIDEKLTEANENTKKRLDDIAVKIQEAQEDIKTEMKNIDKKLKIMDDNFNQTIKKSLSSMTLSLGKKIVWCFVGIATLIIVATLAVVKYIT